MTKLKVKRILDKQGNLIEAIPSRVTRETNAKVHTGKYAGKLLVLEIIAPDIIKIRIKGTRQGFTIGAYDLYYWLCHGKFNNDLKNQKRRRR